MKMRALLLFIAVVATPLLASACVQDPSDHCCCACIPEPLCDEYGCQFLPPDQDCWCDCAPWFECDPPPPILVCDPDTGICVAPEFVPCCCPNIYSSPDCAACCCCGSEDCACENAGTGGEG